MEFVTVFAVSCFDSLEFIFSRSHTPRDDERDRRGRRNEEKRGEKARIPDKKTNEVEKKETTRSKPKSKEERWFFKFFSASETR